MHVWQSDSFRKIQGYIFYWFQNQRIKIEEKEGRQKESKKRSSFALENRKSRASVIFLSLARTPVDGEYEPEKYRVPQFNNVDLDVLGLFTSCTDRRRPVNFKFSLEKSFYHQPLKHQHKQVS